MIKAGGGGVFPVFISPIVWNMCENLHYEEVYSKILLTDNIQTGAAVVSTITRPYQLDKRRLFDRGRLLDYLR